MHREQHKQFKSRKSRWLWMLIGIAVIVLIGISAYLAGSLSTLKKQTNLTKNNTTYFHKKDSQSSEIYSESDNIDNTNIDTNLTPKQIGIILIMDQEPNVISDYLGNSLWYGERNGYNYVSTHGDGTADIYWKVNDDNITVKRLDTDSASIVADEKTMTKTMSLSHLIKKYYNTSQQQRQINADANQLKDEDTQSDSSDESGSIPDLKTMNVCACLLVAPDWFKSRNDISYVAYNDHYGCIQDPDGNLVEVKWSNGNSVTIISREAHHVESQTTTVSVNTLYNDYYNTQKKRNEVDDYVNNLQ